MQTQKKICSLILFLFLLANMILPGALASEIHPKAVAPLTDPIPVYTAADLNNVRNNLSGHFIQMANIDLGGSPWSDGAGWEPIGTESNGFTGVYDGNGFSISNLTISRNGENHVGLFGFTITLGQEQLKNIQLVNASVNGYWLVGGLVGYTMGPVDNCSVSGVIVGNSWVGGIVGKSEAPLRNSQANVSVRGEQQTGGLAGAQDFNMISGCSTSGSVLTEYHGGGMVGYTSGSIIFSQSSVNVTGLRYLGGLAGETAYAPAQVSSCSASGTVESAIQTGEDSITGGLIGLSRTRVSDSYATGDVMGQNLVGGLIGFQPAESVKDCFAEGAVSGYSYVGGLIGQTNSAVIQDSWASGMVTAVNQNVGGLVGWLNATTSASLITDCAAQGDVSGRENVGGLVGLALAPIRNSKATGHVTGTSNIGGLAGSAHQPIQNCQASGNITAQTSAGGLIGSSGTNCLVSSCHATGDVSGHSYLGGLVGDASGAILCSFAIGSVTGQEANEDPNFNYIGGLVGVTRQDCAIVSSYASGPVTGSWYVGGLVGLSYGDFWNSYAEGNVTGDTYVGGLCGTAYGNNPHKEIFRCFSTGVVQSRSPSTYPGGLIGYAAPDVRITDSYYDLTRSGQTDTGKGEPRTTAQMKTGTPSAEIFTNWSEDVWRFTPNDEYPWHRFNRPARIPVDRLAGANRYSTAVSVSQMGWTDCRGGANTVILAVGTNFPDSLAGVTLAYKLNAPILLTTKDSLPASTRSEIQRLSAHRVIILGGVGAVSAAVASDLLTIPGVTEVERIAGDNRYDTARLIAMRSELDYNGIYLASGLDFPDALSAAAYAAQKGRPIMLNGKTTLSGSVKALLNAKPEITLVMIVGGTGAIAESVVTELNTLYPEITVQRIAGANRYDTSLALAAYLWNEGGKDVFLATGNNFPDALAGGVLAAKYNSGVLLVRNTAQTVPGSIQTFIQENTITSGLILGGTSAVSTGLQNDLEQKLKE
jgi:putative cell wall-binding protein